MLFDCLLLVNLLWLMYFLRFLMILDFCFWNVLFSVFSLVVLYGLMLGVGFILVRYVVNFLIISLLLMYIWWKNDKNNSLSDYFM